MIYQGTDGINEVFDRLLVESSDEYLVIALGNELSQRKLVNFFMDFHKRRMSKKVKVRLIADPSLQEVVEQYPRELMFVKYSNVKLPKGTFIFGDNVMSIIWDDIPTAFVITSKKNAQKYREFFEDIWKFALKP